MSSALLKAENPLIKRQISNSILKAMKSAPLEMQRDTLQLQFNMFQQKC